MIAYQKEIVLHNWEPRIHVLSTGIAHAVCTAGLCVCPEMPGAGKPFHDIFSIRNKSCAKTVPSSFPAACFQLLCCNSLISAALMQLSVLGCAISQMRNLTWKATSKNTWFNSGYFTDLIYSPYSKHQTQMQRWKCTAFSMGRRVRAGNSAASFTPGGNVVHSYLGGKDFQYHLNIPCYVL